MHQQHLIPHLYRTEFRKIVSVLCSHFGLDHIETAEDITADTFLAAAESWGDHAIPANPTAWLYHVAKNKTKNLLQRESLFDSKIAPAITAAISTATVPDIDLSPQNISDSQLRMIFVLCHPSIPAEAQVGLSLRILCGFSIDEIAEAFLSNRETINKRLTRAREKLRETGPDMQLPGIAEMDERLAAVMTTIYLLFNEGYYSGSKQNTLRKELCLEAIRLCHMLTEYEATNKPEVNALLALMCFHASRFEARLGQDGELILYAEQDTGLWDAALIGKGKEFLHRAASGNRLSRYHLEAGIAWWHTQKEDSAEKWEDILQVYNLLLQIAYSPAAALNRTYALAKANGKQVAIAEAEKLELKDNHFYFMLLAELYQGIDNAKANQQLETALSLAKTEAEKQLIRRKLALFSQQMEE